MGIETAIIAAAVTATITAGGIIASSAISSGAAKEAGERQLEAQGKTQAEINKIEEERYQAELASSNKIAEEQKAREAELAAKQAQQLKIEAQQYHIATLADILKAEQTYSNTPVILQTAPAKTETNLITQINSWFQNMFRR